MSDDAPKTYYRYFPVAQRDRDWGLFVTTAGESQLGTGVRYPPGGHPKGYDFRAPQGRRLHEHQMIYISAGSGWFKSEASGRVRITAGTLILLFPGVWHSYAPTPTTGWNEHWVGFNGDVARRLTRRGFFSPDQPVFQAIEEDRLMSLFRSLMEGARSNHPALQQVMAGITQLILALAYSAQQSQRTGDDPSLQIIHRAITRMRESGDATLNMPELSSELHVSYRWFRRAFAHHTGMSPHQYFVEVRLARARDLLAQTSLPLKDIATRVGFEDPQYFSRFFHKKIGLSPGTWRQRAQRDQAERC